MNVCSKAATFPSLFVLLAIPTFGQTTSASVARTEGGCPLTNRTLASAPYSALQEVTRLQTLADGTHIERKLQSAQIYRDSQGRHREEFKQVQGPAGVQEEVLFSIRIVDPVECVEYNLEVSKHIARRRTFSPNGNTARTAEQSNVATEPARRPIPEELRPKTSTEPLGTDTIEGLPVEGKRTSTTFPVGSEGNDRPFVVTRETWTSIEPKLLILSKISDPRSGETTQRLTNIQHGEPSPTLFHVPADYQIQDEHP